MKFRYFFIIILAIGIFLQFDRMIRKEDYFSIKQEFSFNKAPAKNTSYKFNHPQKTLVYYSKGSEQSKRILKNVEETFKYTKEDYTVKDVSEVVPTAEYDTFIFATNTFIGFRRETFDAIIKEVNSGKSVIFLNMTPFNPFNPFAGIKNYSEAVLDESKGIKFFQKLFPGIDSYSPSYKMVSHPVLKDVVLENDVKVFAKSDENIPLLWERKLGKGRILYSNVSFFTDKIMRGLMNQWIAYGNEWYISPVLNAKLMHIDDLPSPIPRGDKEVIQKEYGMNTRDFYRNVWIKDMIEIAKKHNLIYTGLIIIDYNNIVQKEKMKRISDLNSKDLVLEGRELFSHNGELGIHGYNHNPIVFADNKNVDFKGLNYVPWRSEEDVSAGAKEVKNYVKELFGKKVKLYTYVAPSNIGTDRGMAILKKNYPDLKTISTVFYGNVKEGSYVQEVGQNPAIPGVYNMPRFSSGFFYDTDEMWNLINAMAVYGYWTHFVHPDDVIAEDRGKDKTWKELRAEFERTISEVNALYPFLRPMKSSEMTNLYMNIEDLKIKSEKVNNEIRIGSINFRRPYEATIRVRNKKIKKMSSGTFKEIYNTGDTVVYLVNIDKENVTLYLGD